MSDKPVNLNRYRKEKARAAKKARADRNAVIHGLPKSERAKTSAENRAAVKDLDGKVLELPQSGTDTDPESP